MPTTVDTAATIRVPAALSAAIVAERGAGSVARWALEALVAEGAREGRLTSSEAGEILGLGYFQTEAFLKEKGVPAVYTDEDYAADKADLLAIVAESRR